MGHTRKTGRQDCCQTQTKHSWKSCSLLLADYGGGGSNSAHFGFYRDILGHPVQKDKKRWPGRAEILLPNNCQRMTWRQWRASLAARVRRRAAAPWTACGTLWWLLGREDGRAGDGEGGGGGGHTITAKLSCCSCCYLQSREEEVVFDPPPGLCYLSKLCPSWTIHPPVHCAAV